MKKDLKKDNNNSKNVDKKKNFNVVVSDIFEKDINYCLI